MTRDRALNALVTLRKVKELLGPKGEFWIKNQMFDRVKGRDYYCLNGAIANAGDGRLAEVIVSDQIRGYIRNWNKRYKGEGFREGILGMISNWNDNKHRRWSQVETLLNTVEKYLEGEVRYGS